MQPIHRLTVLAILLLSAAGAEATTQFSAADYALYPGDFNGDGRTDLLYVGKTPDKVSGIALADANGAPQLGFQSWHATYLGLPWSTGQLIPAIGDFDGDGRSDVLMQSSTAATSYVLLANANPNLAPIGQLVGIHQGISPTAFGIEWPADTHRLHVGDFDGNGKDDVLLQATNRGGTTAIVLSDGSGGLFTASTNNCWAGGPQQCWTDGEQGFQWSTQQSVLHVGRFDYDTRSDILVQARPDFVLVDFDIPIPVPVFRPYSFGIFLAQAPDGAGRIIRTPNQIWSHTDLGGRWSPLNRNLLVGDFNGDGYVDVFVQHVSPGEPNRLAYGASNGTIGTANDLTSNAGAWTANDYNLLVGRFGNSAQAVLYLQAASASGTNYFTGNVTGQPVSTTASSLQTVATVPAPATAVGATTASADVTQNGAAAYTIPIQLPRGTAGLTPSLSLTYSSGSGNGLVGVGWSLAGLGIIARCPKTLAQDSVTQDVQLVTADEYCLNGNRLRKVSGNQGEADSVYRTELETFARITAKVNGTQGPQWFQVETKDGLIYEYGNSSDSRIPVPGGTVTRVWALSNVRDRDQNYWAVTYLNDTANGSYRPDRIDYTANSAQSTAAPYRVQFHYGARNAGENVVNYYQGGLVNQTQRLLRIELQDATNAFALIRKYTLNYLPGSTFNAVSRLASVQECGTNGSCMVPTTFAWSDLQQVNDNVVFESTAKDTPQFADELRVVLDINGDGVPDSVSIDVLAQTVGLVNLGAARGQSPPAQIWAGSVDFEDDPHNNSYDWDSDGKDDLLIQRFAPSPSLWFAHQKADGTFAIENTNNGGQDPSVVADVDGDGFDDWLLMQPGSAPNGKIEVAFHRRDNGIGMEWPALVAWTPPAGTQIKSSGMAWELTWIPRQNITSADVNGDGRQDILALVNGGWRVLYSNGTGFDAGELLVTKYYNVEVDHVPPAAIDINGDGCTDFAFPSNATNPILQLAVSRCRFDGGVGLNIFSTTIAISGDPTQLNVVDWNLDGYQDLVFQGSGQFVALSSGLTLNSPTAISTPGTFFKDLDGDALPDRVNNYEYNSAVGPKPNMLLSATDGFGGQIAFTYAPLTDSAVYTRGTTAVGRTRDVGSSQYVVKQMATSDGIGGTFTQTYKYQGAKTNVRGRGFLGFAGRTVTDSRTGFVTQETYNNTVDADDSKWELVGTLAQSVVRQSASGPIVSELTQTWSALAPDSATNRRYPYVSQSVAKKYELSGPNNPYVTSTTTTTIDNYGTPYDVTTVTTEGITGINPSSSHTHRVYTPLANISNDTTNWCIARPSRIEDIRSHTLTDGGQLARVVEQTWNGPKCRVTNTVTAPGTSWVLNTVVEYDSFNNVKKTTVTGTGVTPTPIITEANYGSNGHLQQWAENALDHRTNFTWNVKCGAPAQQTDPNGLITSWTYDDLCREQRMTRPDGTSTYKTYYQCEQNNNYCGDSLLRYASRTSERNATDGEITWVDRFFDMKGRVKYEQTRAFDGVKTIGVHTLYDDRGNVATQSNPFFVGGGSVAGVLHTYDLLNRLVRTDRPVSDASQVIVSEWINYNGLTTETVDAIGKTQSKVTSAWGTVVRATDEALQNTAYTYNAFGDLRTVKDPLNNTTSLTYNVRGFKTAQSDPDLGNWTYTYDALGRMLTQVDAKSQTTTFTYDLLNRTKTRDDHPVGPSNRTTWTWDTATNGKGLLASVTSPGSYSETYTYDNKSRPLTATTLANGTNFVMEYTYDTSTGRVATTKYPTSTGTRLTVQHAYQNGFLKDLRDGAAPNPPLWQANAQDAFGHVTQEQFANGHVTNLGFDQTNGRLYSVQTGLPSNPLVQNLSYHWDAVGNLLRRTEGLQAITETFAYDANHRLTTVQRNGSTTLTMVYDAIGNVTSKSDAGSYLYANQAGCPTHGHTQPHAVRKVGTNVYCYDANGNMTSRSGSSVTWSTFNYPTQINQAGGNTSTFYYGASRNAYRQVSVNSGTTENRVTVGDGAFERLIRGSQTEYRHFISANGRVVAIVKRSSQTGNKKFYLHADHLGSTDVITDETSAVYLRTSHDAWGQRRGGATWSGAPTTPEKTAVNASTHRGYTGHEQLDNLNLVHMKGRVYDPAIARFMSADPIIQSPFRSQSFNRYSYVWNNPLNAVDPTGFCLVTGSRVSYDDCEVDGFGVAYGVRYGSGSGAPGVRESGQTISLQADTASTLRDAGRNSAQRSDSAISPQGGPALSWCLHNVCFRVVLFRGFFHPPSGLRGHPRAA